MDELEEQVRAEFDSQLEEYMAEWEAALRERMKAAKPADESSSEKSWLPDLHPLFRFGEDIPSEGDTANG